jgi:hypothetical protein
VNGGGRSGQRSRSWLTSAASSDHEGQAKYADDEKTPDPHIGGHTQFTPYDAKGLTGANIVQSLAEVERPDSGSIRLPAKVAQSPERRLSG